MTVVAIKGVDPGTQNIYLTEKFKCIDGNGYGLVNDDYCDCIDGSDEPGTNACYDGKFYCQNEGYLSTFIPSWLVSDGICECCDGSDEVEGLCENTCQERSSKALNEKHKQEKQRKLGAMSKLRMIETAKLLRIKKRLEIEKLTREIDSLKKEKYSTEILIKTLEYQLDDPHQGWIDKLQGMAYHWPETGFYLFNKVFHEMEVGSGLVEDRDRLENDLQVGRSTLSDLQLSLDSAQKSKGKLELDLNSENGRNEIYLPYRNECLQWNDSGYQYNFCWFDEVKQDHTSLGKFGNSIWDVKGSVMVYSGGSACWNGPERATFVHLICGEKTEIISVEEPDKCQYLMKINTPVVCEIEKADREDFKEHDQFHSEL